MKVCERVRLHLKTKRTIDGVLLSKRRGVYTLSDAFVENEDGKLMPAQGKLYIDRIDVEFAQQGWAS